MRGQDVLNSLSWYSCHFHITNRFVPFLLIRIHSEAAISLTSSCAFWKMELAGRQMKSLVALLLPEWDLEQMSKDLMFLCHSCSENTGMCTKYCFGSVWFNPARCRILFKWRHFDFVYPLSDVLHLPDCGFANTCVVFWPPPTPTRSWKLLYLLLSLGRNPIISVLLHTVVWHMTETMNIVSGPLASYFLTWEILKELLSFLLCNFFPQCLVLRTFYVSLNFYSSSGPLVSLFGL